MADAAARTESRRWPRRVDPRILRELGPLIALLGMCAILTALSDNFLTVDNLMNIFRQSAVNVLLALGQLVVIVSAGIDLSVGSVLGFACVLAAIMMKAGFPAWLSCLAAVAVGLGLGTINGLLLTRLRLPHPFIPTLGMMNVARGMALVISGGFPISDLPAGFRWLGAGRIAFIPAPVVLVLVVCAIFHFFLTRTAMGRDIYAIGGNKQAAILSGIPVDSRLTWAYALSGGTAGLAAIVLAGRMNSGYPLAGAGAELDSIAAVIIGGASFFGGVGTVSGTLLGALIIGVLRNGLNLLDVSSYWQTAVIGVVIVVAVWIDVLRQRSGGTRPRKA